VALAVCVLHELDLEPGAPGLVLTADPVVRVPWEECRRALGGADPESAAGRRRLADHLLARRWCADAGPERLTAALRPLGLPAGHPCHPGASWVRERVLGDCLELGFGAVGLDPGDPDQVVVVPPEALAQLGLSPDALWPPVRGELERLGALAGERVRLDPKGALRPFGDCDALTLLGARSLRRALCAAAGGMVAAVVPMRRRGWTRLTGIDPAFGPAAAAATDPAERGFARPLLLTVDEVTQVAPGGAPHRTVLLDPPLEDRAHRDVLYGR